MLPTPTAQLTPQQIAELEAAAQRVAAGQLGGATYTNGEITNAGDVANLAFAKERYGWTPSMATPSPVATPLPTYTPMIPPTASAETPTDIWGSPTPISPEEQAALDRQQLLAEQQAAGTSSVDEAKIRQDILDQYQREIDTLNSIYATQYQQARQAGLGRLGSSSAIQARRGLLGSDFGEAQTANVETANQQVISAIDAEKAFKIQQIYSTAKKEADDLIKAKTEAVREGADKLVEFYKTKKERIQNSVKTTAKSALDSGQIIPEEKWAEWAKIIGSTPEMLKAEYNSQKKAADKEAEKGGFTLGEGQMRYDAEGNLIATGGASTQSISEKYGTGIIGEYNFALEKGWKGTGDKSTWFTQYQNEDNNRKILAQKALVAGIDPALVSIGNNLGAKFDSSPIVKQYNEVQNKKLGIDRLLSEGKISGPQDVALVYDFMKALDPTSVVRESEYAMGASSGNLFLGALAKFNGLFREGGGKLPENVKKEFQNIINQRYGAISQQYDNLDSETRRKMKAMGINDPSMFLTDYTQAETSTTGGNIQNSYNTNPPDGWPSDYSEAVRQAGGEDVLKQMLDAAGINFNQVGGDTNQPTSMRTDRHNNPTAFTTDIAKLAGLKEGVDYVAGDKFPDSNLKTAKLLGNAVDTTIKVIDKIGFTTASGKPRWTYINMPKSQWNALSYEEKKQVISGMYKREGGTQLNNLFA